MTTEPAWNAGMHPPDLETFAGRLRIAMGTRSIREVAARAGITRRGLLLLIRGPKRGAYVDTIIAVANACGVTPAWLAFGESDPAPPVVRS